MLQGGNGKGRPRRPGGQVKEHRSVWFANRFGSMRSTGARPSLIRASAPLVPPHAFVLSLFACRLPAPRSLLHRNSIVLTLSLLPSARRFSRSVPDYPIPPPSPSSISLYVYNVHTNRKTRTARNTCVSYAGNVRTTELHVSSKHPTRKVITSGLELYEIDEITRISGFGWTWWDLQIRYWNLLRGPFLMKEGNPEGIFGDLNPIVLMQRSGGEKSPKISRVGL